MKTAGILLLTSLLCACVSSQVLENWPEELPDQHNFVAVYREDPANQPLQSEVEYLTWIVRFYEGWELMPMGWHDIEDSMLLDLAPRDRDYVADRLESIGVRISAEWAKDNSVRTIDTAMLSLWGGVMQADFSTAARIAAVDMIGADVAELLEGDLSAEDITERRYAQALGISLEP